MSDKNIESILQESRNVPPPDAVISKATLNNKTQLTTLRDRANTDYEGFWAEQANQYIDWHTPFQTILNSKNAPHYNWFEDGQLNVSYNCLDRHLETQNEKLAIIFEGEQGDIRQISYQELHNEVCRFANGLLAQGIKQGDRVIIYMPMVH